MPKYFTQICFFNEHQKRFCWPLMGKLSKRASSVEVKTYLQWKASELFPNRENDIKSLIIHGCPFLWRRPRRITKAAEKSFSWLCFNRITPPFIYSCSAYSSHLVLRFLSFVVVYSERLFSRQRWDFRGLPKSNSTIHKRLRLKNMKPDSITTNPVLFFFFFVLVVKIITVVWGKPFINTRRVVGWERVPTPYCASNVTWRVRFFISISSSSAWSSINDKRTNYLVYSTVAWLRNYSLWRPQWYLRTPRFISLFAFIETLLFSFQRSTVTSFEIFRPLRTRPVARF